jgi:hypothetical protein
MSTKESTKTNIWLKDYNPENPSEEKLKYEATGDIPTSPPDFP